MGGKPPFTPPGQGPVAGSSGWGCSPVWLALPGDWQEHPVLRRTAEELGRMGGTQQLES